MGDLEGNDRRLVEEAFAPNGAAKTGNTIRAIEFALKLVIVGEFLICEGCQYLAQTYLLQSTHSLQCP